MNIKKIVTPVLMLLLSFGSFLVNKDLSLLICEFCFILYFFNCISNIHTHFLSMIFGISCFSFLFGVIIFDPHALNNISDERVALYLSLLSLSLSCIQFGNIFSNNKKKNNFENDNLEEFRNCDKTLMTYKVAKKIYWFSFIFCILEALIRAKYMINYGYVYLYYHPDIMTTGINGIITNLSSLNNVCLIVLLACLPKVKDVRKEFIATLIYAVLIMMSGARAKLLNSVFLFVSYIFIINFSYENKKMDIKKITKYSILVLLLITILPTFFLNVASYRSGLSDQGTYSNGFVELITSEGNAWKNVINSTYIYESTSSTQHILFYTSPFVKAVTLQFILNKIGISFFPTTPYTSDYALNSYNYSHFYTYTLNPSLYLSGGGLGSSYLAESYMFGKWFGVVLHSILIGLFFAKTSSGTKKFLLLKNGYIFTVLSNIFWSPRSSALESFFSFFSFSNLVVWFGLYLIIYLAQSRNKRVV